MVANIDGIRTGFEPLSAQLGLAPLNLYTIPVPHIHTYTNYTHGVYSIFWGNGKDRRRAGGMGHHLVARTLHINHFYDLLFFTIYFTSRPVVVVYRKKSNDFLLIFVHLRLLDGDFCKLQHYLACASDAGWNNCRTPSEGLWGIVIKGNS